MACTLVEQMKGWSLQPDLVSYASAMTSCNRGREWAKALLSDALKCFSIFKATSAS